MLRKSRKAVVSLSLLSSLVLGSLTAFAGTVSFTSDGPNIGQTALQIVKQYLGPDPVDGPDDAGHFYESTSSQVGNVFVMRVGDASDSAAVDGGNTDRQRLEIKAYNSSQSNVKGFQNETVTYKWKFRPMSPYPTSPSGNFHHIFQVKASGGSDADMPIFTFSADGSNLKFRHSSSGSGPLSTLAQTAFSNVDGQWVEATVSIQNKDSGNVTMTLKKLDGTTLMSYSGTHDNWRTGADFNRPKWGIYRKIFTGLKEAKIQFADFSITK